MKWSNPEKRIKFLEEKVKDLEKTQSEWADRYYTLIEIYEDDITKVSNNKFYLIYAYYPEEDDDKIDYERPICVVPFCEDYTKKCVSKLNNALNKIKLMDVKEIQENLSIQLGYLPSSIEYKQIDIIPYTNVIDFSQLYQTLYDILRNTLHLD